MVLASFESSLHSIIILYYQYAHLEPKTFMDRFHPVSTSSTFQEGLVKMVVIFHYLIDVNLHRLPSKKGGWINIPI